MFFFLLVNKLTNLLYKMDSILEPFILKCTFLCLKCIFYKKSWDNPALNCMY